MITENGKFTIDLKGNLETWLNTSEKIFNDIIFDNIPDKLQ